jgi:hypothetical protein
LRACSATGLPLSRQRACASVTPWYCVAAAQEAAGAEASRDGECTTTPGTARLRYLEEHPEQALGGSRLAASPEEGTQKQKKLTAEERHYSEWGDAF